MKKRLLAAIMSLCMIVSLMPISSMAAWWGGSGVQSGNTVVRFYVVGTGSTKGYNVSNQPMSGGDTTPLYVTEDCALIEDLTVETSTAPQELIYNQGDQNVRDWLDIYANGVPSALTNIGAIVNTVNAEYKKYDIPTQLKTEYFNAYKFESANWEPSDAAYHVHVLLERQECTVTFDYNYEDAPGATTDKVGKGTAVDQPAAPTREGYDFTGWYTDKACEHSYNFDALVTEDITLYAGWQEKKPEGPPITVTKELATVNGKSVVGQENVVLYDGDRVNWTIQITNNTDEKITVKIADTAKYASNKPGVDNNEVSLTNYLTDEFSSLNPDTVNISANGTKEISLILPHEVDSGDYQDYEGGMLTNTATVTYDGEPYTDSTENPIGHILTVTYNGNGGTIDGVENGDKTVRKTVYAPEVPYTYTVETGDLDFQREGYTFDGWYKDAECTKVAETDTLSGGATYYAKWIEDEEQVDPATDIFFFIALPTNKAMSGSENDYRYLTHGGVINKELADAAQINATGITSLDDESEITRFVSEWPTAITDLPGETNVGFDIASQPVESDSSWTIDANGNVSEFSIIITDENNEKHTYTSDEYGIRWAKISYATTADPDNPGPGGIDASKRYHVDGVLYEKETVSDVLTNGNFQKTVDSDTLSYNDQGTAKASEEFSFILDMLTGENGTPSAQFSDIDLTATITSEAKTAEISLPENSTAGSTPLTPGYYVIKEKLEGDQADAWSTPESIYFELTSNGNVVVGDKVINNTLKTYTLSYNANGGNGGPTEQTGLKYNELAPLSTTAPTKDNSTFLGWATTSNATVPTVTDPIQIKGDTTLYAVWQTNTAPTMYTVTFDSDGGTVVEPQQVVDGEKATMPDPAPTRDGYTFAGWYLGDTAYDFDTPVTGNITLVAHWTDAKTYTVTIAPADITVYTGGEAYGAIVGEDGEIVSTSASGLPEPGYHITLSQTVMDWLNLETGEPGARDLADYLTFQYEDDANQREWKLTYLGVYSTEPMRYVYSMSPVNPENPDVRLEYTDSDGVHRFDDEIEMGPNAASAEYTMSIYGGELEQSDIQAVLTANGDTLIADVVIETGTLTIRSTVTDDTNAIVGNESDVSGGFTAVDTGASYMVNDSQVQVPTEGGRIHLLVDQVSDSADFNTAMGEAALGHANMPDASYDTAYLDLVDTQNGNAVVTLENGSVDIYWPMPADADPGDTFQVVHYYNMNRENTVDADNLHEQAAEVLYGTAVSINGDWYVRFTTDSFSPFVLVWESAEEPTPDPDPDPTPDPGEDDDDHDRPHGGSGGSDPTGNLSIELDVNGGDDAFTFTVILTDKNGKDLKNNFYYNGDYTGTIGSGDEITLEGGEKIVIRNLPEGTRYEVIIETADGYTYIIDGEEGVIHIGMNEAEFTANRTVSLADPSVTGVSRWLNTTDHIAYLTGYPSGAFGPDNSMTRAEVAQMFYALLNNKNVTITKTFPDVPSDAWYATAVNTLASLGMVSGDADGSFRPNDPITRAEFCVIALAFAYEPENAVCYFGDVSRSDWFYTYVAQAASYGWIGGYANGNFGPNDQITRAQVTTIVNNMLGRAADRNYVIDHQADLVQFSDLTRAHWGYFQIMEATNAHDYTKSNGSENWR